MRNYEGMKLPPAVDPHLRNELLKVDTYLKQVARSLGAVGSGNNPGPKVQIVVSGGGSVTSSLPDHDHSATGLGGSFLGNSFGTITASGIWLYPGTIVAGGTVPLTGAHVSIINNGTTNDRMLALKGKAGQLGEMMTVFTSANERVAAIGSYGAFIAQGTATHPAGFYFFDPEVGGSSSATIGTINWGGFPVGPPQATADMLGCVGGRIYTYKDTGGQFDNGYGQDVFDAWVLVSDDSVTYSIYTVLSAGATPYLRAQWAGNGDLTNYGKVRSRKSLKTTGVAKGVPGIELEQTGTGTNAAILRAPELMTTDRTQTLLDVSGLVLADVGVVCWEGDVVTFDDDVITV